MLESLWISTDTNFIHWHSIHQPTCAGLSGCSVYYPMNPLWDQNRNSDPLNGLKRLNHQPTNHLTIASIEKRKKKGNTLIHLKAVTKHPRLRQKSKSKQAKTTILLCTCFHLGVLMFVALGSKDSPVFGGQSNNRTGSPGAVLVCVSWIASTKKCLCDRTLHLISLI